MAAHTNPKVHMGTLTGGEGRELYKSNPVILLPMGSHEDQGPHAPMGDYLLAEKISELAAIRATNNGTRTVVAPVLPFGADDYFGPMPGGIKLSRSLMTNLIQEMVDNLYRHGLTRIIAINGHGGNVGPINEVARAMYVQHKRIIPSLYLWRIAYGLIPQVAPAGQGTKSSGHGADPLTSIGMHLFPELIRKDMIPKALPLKKEQVLDLPFTALGTASFEGAEIGLPHEYDEVYNLGVGTGDATLCTPETGEKLTERLVETCARFAAHFASRVK